MARTVGPAVAVLSLHASPVGALGRGENGGGNLAIRRLCEGLARAGVATDVFVRRDDPELPAEELIAPSSRLVRIAAGPPLSLPKQALVEHVPAYAQAIRAHAASQGRSYSVIHAHYWLAGLAADRLRDCWTVPWVQSFHTLARTKASAGLPVDLARDTAEAAIVARCDRVIAGSVAEARDLIRLYRAPRRRICVVQLGVDLRALRAGDVTALRRSLGLEGHRVLLFAGRLEPLKGADIVLEAVARLEAPRFDDVVALVIGEDSGDGAAAGGERRRLEEVAGERGIQTRVRFLGAVVHEQLAGYYRLADVCVVPSKTESFGLVALEAQALGTPVVAAAVGGLIEVVDDGRTGLLVRGRDPSAFAEAITALLDDDDRRAAMGEAARRRAATFTWDRSVQRLVAIYGRLTGAAGLAPTPCGYEDEVVALAG